MHTKAGGTPPPASSYHSGSPLAGFSLLVSFTTRTLRGRGTDRHTDLGWVEPLLSPQIRCCAALCRGLVKGGRAALGQLWVVGILSNPLSHPQRDIAGGFVGIPGLRIWARGERLGHPRLGSGIGSLELRGAARVLASNFWQLGVDLGLGHPSGETEAGSAVLPSAP